MIGKYLGIKTNNEAEYEALIMAASFAKNLDVLDLTLFTDSQLMARQMTGIYQCRMPSLAELKDEALTILEGSFERWSIVHVKREQNQEADRACNLILDDPQRRALRENFEGSEFDSAFCLGEPLAF